MIVLPVIDISPSSTRSAVPYNPRIAVTTNIGPAITLGRSRPAMQGCLHTVQPSVATLPHTSPAATTYTPMQQHPPNAPPQSTSASAPEHHQTHGPRPTGTFLKMRHLGVSAERATSTVPLRPHRMPPATCAHS
ncbi:hypothetical protein BV22DRAFT_409685 [Leucogyrophana mollusca]|uniref:Uncharacterized protein n=1 Tax=Leucogyrophana mollusca TaxID=85980 RepID=A0ACB8BMM0_9AGAM|nr:hypothetical protein BV22DRAFT_409685 [Leucogyrophana mollusca]